MIIALIKQVEFVNIIKLKLFCKIANKSYIQYYIIDYMFILF